MRILIIEDDQTLAHIYRNKFLVEGFEVEIAFNGEAGFETAKTFRPDAIVLDLILPGISGIELIKKIRAEPGFQKTPIVVFSNTYLTKMIQEAWKAGASKCLSKANCTPKQVIDLVRSAVGNKGSAAAAGSSPAATATAQQTVRGGLSPQRLTAIGSDEEFQAGLLQSFVKSLPGTLAALRTQLQGLIKADNEMARLEQVRELHRHVHHLTGNAAIAGLLQIALMADVFEALLRELYEKPKNINASTLRTIASAIDLLGVLFKCDTLPGKQEAPAANILVVDDEAISRRAITFALEKARLKSVSVEDTDVAFKLLSKNSFDLVFLDVDMPGMNGFELCTRLRALPAHANTPVVFVTGLNDLESRANSTVSGGNDFIGKPFLFVELAVKALVYVLRRQIGTGR